MANVRNGNTIYIDTGSVDLTTTGTRVYYIILTPTAANATMTLQDAGANANKLTISEATDDNTETFDFTARPLFFPGGVAVTTLTNCVATLVVEVQGGG